MFHRHLLILPFSFLLSSAALAQDACSQLSELRVLSWAYEAMMATYNMNFTNYQTKLPNAAKYYTQNAWMDYQKALYANISPIQKEKLVISVGAENSPIFLRQSNDSYAVRIPLLINYQSQSSKHTEKRLVTLEIAKDSHAQSCLKIQKITEN